MATRFEFLDAGDDTAFSIAGADVACQTFTPQITHTITSVKIYVYATADPGMVAVSIRATAGHLPIGGDLATGSIDGSTIGGVKAWHEIELTPYEVSAEVEYAIVVNPPADGLVWRADSDDGYARGQAGLDEGGGGWATFAAYDDLFEEWGEPLVSFVPRPSGSCGGILIV